MSKVVKDDVQRQKALSFDANRRPAECTYCYLCLEPVCECLCVERALVCGLAALRAVAEAAGDLSPVLEQVGTVGVGTMDFYREFAPKKQALDDALGNLERVKGR